MRRGVQCTCVLCTINSRNKSPEEGDGPAADEPDLAVARVEEREARVVVRRRRLQHLSHAPCNLNTGLAVTQCDPLTELRGRASHRGEHVLRRAALEGLPLLAAAPLAPLRHLHRTTHRPPHRPGCFISL